MFLPLSSPLHVVLVSPQIPPNTGNVARLCACTGARLILVEPLGFRITDRELRRAGLDYWDKVFVALYPDYDAYVAAWPDARRFLFEVGTGRSSYDVRYAQGDHLVFGPEPTGLSESLLAGGSGVPVTLPMQEGRRSLNLSTSVGIATYEALRQLHFGLESP